MARTPFLLAVIALTASAGIGIARTIGVSPRAAEAARVQPAEAGRGLVAEGVVAAYPDAHVTVGSEVVARIVELSAQVRASVRRGEVLAEFDAAEADAAVAEARARAGEAEADAAFAAWRAERQGLISGSDASAAFEDEATRRELAVARARAAAAAAAVARAEAHAGKHRLRSPIDGTVTRRHADRGEVLTEGAPVVTVIDLTRLRVEAEIDEFDVAAVRLGARVEIGAEGAAGTWTGVVEEIPDQLEPRRLRPEDPGRPADTRVLAVKIRPDSPLPLKVGQRVDLRIAAGGP